MFRFRIVFVVSMLICFGVWSEPAAAVPIGFSGPALTDDVSFDPAGRWVIPLEIHLDPTAGPLDLDLISPLNEAGDALLELPIGTAIPMRQSYVVTPPPTGPESPITGWFATVSTPGWEWTNTLTVTVDDSEIVPNVDPSSSTTALVFGFDPVGSTSTLVIDQELRWIGVTNNTTWGDGVTDDQQSAVNEDFVEVALAAVPEPASALLLVPAAMLALGRRRSR